MVWSWSYAMPTSKRDCTATPSDRGQQFNEEGADSRIGVGGGEKFMAFFVSGSCFSATRRLGDRKAAADDGGVGIVPRDAACGPGRAGRLLGSRPPPDWEGRRSPRLAPARNSVGEDRFRRRGR